MGNRVQRMRHEECMHIFGQKKDSWTTNIPSHHASMSHAYDHCPMSTGRSSGDPRRSALSHPRTLAVLYLSPSSPTLTHLAPWCALGVYPTRRPHPRFPTKIRYAIHPQPRCRRLSPLFHRNWGACTTIWPRSSSWGPVARGSKSSSPWGVGSKEQNELGT